MQIDTDDHMKDKTLIRYQQHAETGGWCLNGVIIHDFFHFQCINFMLHQHAVLTSLIHLQSKQINTPVRHGDTAVKSGIHWQD